MIVLCWKNHLVLQGRVREVGCALVFSTENARDERVKAVQKGLPSTLGSPIANALELTIANYANGT